jgi:signal transduction histidine kinase
MVRTPFSSQPAAIPFPPDRLRRWFRLMFVAVEHEVANSIPTLHLVSHQQGKGGETVNALITSYRNLESFRSLSEAASVHDLKALLSELQGKDVNEISVKDGEDAWEQVHAASLETVRRFRSLLLGASAMFPVTNDMSESTRSNLIRVVKYGSMLAEALEKLMDGSFDFAMDMVAQRVTGNSSLEAACNQCASENICFCSFASESMNGVRISSNPFFMRLIISNIISNAKRASGEAKGEALIDVCVTRTRAGMIAASFTDHGCGMSEDVVGKLNSGVQVSTKPNDGGTHGLGFAYCRELAEKMGGRLYVESSAEGKGTTVVLELREALEQK